MRRIAIASVGVGVLVVGLLGVVAGPASASHESTPFAAESLRSIPTVGDAICDTIEEQLISKNPGGPQDVLVDLWHHGFCPVGGATTPPPPEDDEDDPTAEILAVLCPELLRIGGEAQDGGMPDEFNLFLIAAGELCEGDPCAADDPPEECIEDPCAVDDPPAECDDPPDTSTTTTTTQPDGGGDDDAEVRGATETGGGNTVQAASAEGDGSLPRTGGDLLAGASAGVSFLALSGLVRRFARR